MLLMMVERWLDRRRARLWNFDRLAHQQHTEPLRIYDADVKQWFRSAFLLKVVLSSPFAGLNSELRAFPVLRWARFLEKHPRPHLVVGATRRLVKWRDNVLLRLIAAHPPSGQFAFRRDFDQQRACYLVLMAFEDEIDALKFSQLVRAEKKVDEDPGYASKHEFDFDSANLTAALKRGKRNTYCPATVGQGTTAQPARGLRPLETRRATTARDAVRLAARAFTGALGAPVRPEAVVEVTYLTWTEGGLLRAVSYQWQRDDKPARQVVR